VSTNSSTEQPPAYQRDRFFTLLHNNKHIHFSESSVFWLSRFKKLYVHLCSRPAGYCCCHKIHHNSARPHSVILVAAMLQPLMCWWSLWYSLDLEDQVLKDKQMIIFTHTIWINSNSISTKLCPTVTLYHMILQICCMCSLKTSGMNVVKRQKFMEPTATIPTQNNEHKESSCSHWNYSLWKFSSFNYSTPVQMTSIVTNILSEYSQSVHEFFSTPEKYNITRYDNSKWSGTFFLLLPV
jgi:hypothetical protein